MAVHYIFGGAGAGKSYELCRRVKELARKEPKTNFLVIVPEQFTLQTQKDFVTLSGESRGIMNIDVLSFLRLAYRVFEETGGAERIVLEDTGKSMIVKKVAMQHERELLVFGRNVHKAGFITEIKSILSEFYQYDIGTEELLQMQTAAGNNTALKKKLADIGLLYQAFQDFLADRYITTEGILSLLGEKAGESRKIKGAVLCFDGFTGFTPSQYALLSELMKYARDCYFTVTMDPSCVFVKLKEYELFHLSAKTVQWIDQLAIKSGQEIGEPVILSAQGRHGAAESLKFLEMHLFRAGRAAYKKTQENIRIYAHRDIHEEITWGVTEIYRLIKEGMRYREIAVITGDLEGYADGLAKEFARAGLPCFIDRKKKLTDNPVIEFIRAAMEVVRTDFSYDAVFHYMKSPLAGFGKEEQDIFENYIRARGIKHYSMYKKPWKAKYRTAYPVELEKIEAVRKELLRRFGEFYTVFARADATGRERMTQLVRFLILHGTERYLEEKSQELMVAEPVRAREYAQLWRILLEIFDRIVGLLGEDAMTLKEFEEILQTGFDEAKVGLVPPGLDQIMVGDMERTRLNSVRCLFFLGINEGVVPKPQAGGGVLSEQDRLLFEENGIELAPNRRQNAFLSEFYLYLSLTKPSERLYLSYRRSDSAGKAMRPSYLLSRVQKLFPELSVCEGEGDGILAALGTDRGFSRFLQGVREYAAGEKPAPLFAELYALYRAGELAAPLAFSSVAAAAFYQKPEAALSAANAKKLYGQTLSGSVTRLEQYAACAFAHFLMFGLSVEERAEYQIGMPDIGTVYHNALRYYSAGVKESEYNWHTIPEEKSAQLLADAADQAVKEYSEGIFASSMRSRELVQRIKRMLRRTVDTVQLQIRRGDFEPEEFEYDFTHADRYLALRGRIDRIDLYRDGQENYIRVVDYKSGNTQFKLEKLYYGLSLQLAVYMEAAMQWAKEKGMEAVVPAGMLYYHIDDPIVAKGGDTEEQIQKKLIMNGLVNADKKALVAQDKSFYSEQGGLAAGVTSRVIPAATGKSGNLNASSMAVDEAYFGDVLKCARERLYENAKKILAGDVEPAPYRRGSENACEWCVLKDACNFDRRLAGYRYRDLKKLERDEIREKICKNEEANREKRTGVKRAEGAEDTKRAESAEGAEDAKRTESAEGAEDAKRAESAEGAAGAGKV